MRVPGLLSACLAAIVLSAAAAPCRAGENEPGPGLRFLFETGVRAGAAAGVESPAFSTWRVNTDIGLLLEQGGNSSLPFDAGITLHLTLGDEDMPIALKPRIRFELGERWTADLSAGPILTTLEAESYVASGGVIGGVMLIYEDWLALGADILSRSIGDRTRYENGLPAGIIEGGREYGIYGGVTMTGRAGTAATIVWWTVFLAFALYVGANLS